MMKVKAVLLASLLLAGCQSTHIPESSQKSNEIASKSAYSSLEWLKTPSGQYQDLWNYVGNDLSIKAPNNDRVKREKARYLKNKSYLPTVANRAEPYMYWIVEQIKQRDIPMEIALLPIVESEFNPHVVSPAKAAGIWQMVPTTGSYYGLRQDEWFDGRKDVIASTKAALDMLERLNEMFDGDWLLTVAAYNSGEGRILNAVKRNKSRGLPTDFWSLSLPKETTVYVPRLLALADVVKNAERYGIDMPISNPDKAIDQIDIGQQIELAQVAKLSGVPLNKLKSLNAGYKHKVTPPNGPHRIAIPKSHTERFINALAAHDNRFIDSVSYVVKSGDSLDSIATAYQSNRYIIAKTNQLADASLKAGRKIIIPAYNSVVNESLLKQKSQKEKKQVVERKGRYTVVSGDSLYKIARKLGVGMNDLQRWNSLGKNAMLRPGHQLTYYVNSNNARKITYSIKRGDTMTSIARQFNLDIEDMLSWNTTLANAHQLSLGDKLTLYVI